MRNSILALLASILAACGGVSPVSDSALEAPPNAQEWRTSPEFGRWGMTRAARDDYYESMDRHYTEGQSSLAAHPRHHGGWFQGWTQRPLVALPQNATAYEVAAVRRAVDVINRALLPEHRLRVEQTSNAFTQAQMNGPRGTPTSTAWQRIASSRIHVQFGHAAPGSPPVVSQII